MLHYTAYYFCKPGLISFLCKKIKGSKTTHTPRGAEPSGGMNILIRPAKTRNLKLLILITFTLLVFAGVKLYDLARISRHSYITVSETPARHAALCQELGTEYKIDWFHLAAYFYAASEHENLPYPGREEIADLAAIAAEGDFLNYIKKMKGSKFAALTKIRAREIRIRQKFFSPEYTFPVGGEDFSFTNTWLAPRDGGSRQHLGTDIFASEGTPLVACTGGTIERKGWNRLGGNRIGLRGRDGLYYYYAHLSGFAPGIEEGTQVTKGTVIGYVGHSGNAVNTPDHLHFGMQTPWGDWINPYHLAVYWEILGDSS